MKKSAVLAAFASAGAIALMLAGCSSGGGGASTGSKSTSLVVEDYYTSTFETYYNACASKVGAKLTFNHISSAGLNSKVLQQASSRTLPDLLMLNTPDIPSFAETGALSPLKDYGLNGNGDASGVVQTGSYKGTLYALAPVVNSLALYYNTDLLKAANITPPKTWDELKADALKLTDKSKGVYGFAMSNINTHEGTFQFLPFFWTNGGDETNIDTPAAAQALQFVVDLQNDGSMSKSSVNWAQSDVNNQFIARKAAMMINGPWQVPTLNATKGLHFASVPVPVRMAGQTPVAPLGGEAFTVPNTGNKAKMALAGKMVGCLNSPAMQTKIATGTGNVPSNLAQGAAFAKANPQLASFVTVVKTARSRNGKLGAKWPAAETAIYTAQQLALTGKATPTEALKKAESDN